jgi:hypothetical protein
MNRLMNGSVPDSLLEGLLELRETLIPSCSQPCHSRVAYFGRFRKLYGVIMKPCFGILKEKRARASASAREFENPGDPF